MTPAERAAWVVGLDRAEDRIDEALRPEADAPSRGLDRYMNGPTGILAAPYDQGGWCAASGNLRS